MAYLEHADARDRQDGTLRFQRLRQISPQTGRFLALMAASAPQGRVLEIGASAGYSALWLALACRQRGDPLVTFEHSSEKVAMARETFALAGVEDFVEVVQGDALHFLAEYRRVAFCFLDAEKELYQDCYDLVIPNLVSGGVFIADNALSHSQELKPFIDRALSDLRLDALVLPVGKGLLFCRAL
jgi:predicted O-methyltransferase YrrM